MSLFSHKQFSASLAAAHFRATAVIVALIYIFTGSYWGYTEYQKYAQQQKRISQDYLQESQKSLQKTMDTLFALIATQSFEVEEEIKLSLQQKVQAAFTLASHMQSRYQGKLSPEQIKDMIVESLRPMRWEMGDGYFFILEKNSNKFVLNAAHPELEMMDAKIENISAFKKIVQYRGAGFNYYYMPRHDADKDAAKVSFVKLFKPYNWIIGSGSYIDNFAKISQKHLKSLFHELQFGENGYILCFDQNGRTIVDFDTVRQGRFAKSIIDRNGRSYGQQLLDIGRIGIQSGYYRYTVNNQNSKATQRLAYIRRYKPWNWTIVTSVELENMSKAIAQNKERYQKKLVEGALFYICATIVILLLLLGVFFLFTRRINHDFSRLEQYIGPAKKSPDSLPEFHYKEINSLAKQIHQSQVENIATEQRAKTSELCIDTLLKLWPLATKGLTELSSFALKQLCLTTRASHGYIAILDREHKEFKVVATTGFSREEIKNKHSIIGHSFAAAAARRGKAYYQNGSKTPHHAGVYPEELHIFNHLDVPCKISEQTVLVGGVCNKDGIFSAEDIKHANLIVNGIWHVLSRQSQIQENEHQQLLLQNIYNAIPSPIIIVDALCTIISCNHAATVHCQVEMEQLLGKKFNLALPLYNSFLKNLVSAIKNKTEQNKRTFSHIQGKQLIHEIISVSPIRYSSFIGAIFRIDDISEQVKQEEIYAQTRSHVTLASSIAGVSQELQGPLNSLMQELQQLRYDLAAAAPENRMLAEQCDIKPSNLECYLNKKYIYETLHSLHNSAMKSKGIMDAIVKFSTFNPDFLSYEDIQTLIGISLEQLSNNPELQAYIDFPRIKIETNFPENMDKIACSRPEMLYLLSALLTNAFEAIAISRNHVTGLINIAVINEKNKELRIEISDNGAGINPGINQQLFTPFFTTKKQARNIGLGLTTAAYIAKQHHNGKISLHSILDQGTTVTLCLPLDPPKLEVLPPLQ